VPGGLSGDWKAADDPAGKAAWWSDMLFEVWYVWRDRIRPDDFLTAFAEWSEASAVGRPDLNFEHWLFPLARKIPARVYLAGMAAGDKSILPDSSIHDHIDMDRRHKKQRRGRDYRDYRKAR
jgi:hypothetical protein